MEQNQGDKTFQVSENLKGLYMDLSVVKDYIIPT